MSGFGAHPSIDEAAPANGRVAQLVGCGFFTNNTESSEETSIFQVAGLLSFSFTKLWTRVRITLQNKAKSLKKPCGTLKKKWPKPRGDGQVTCCMHIKNTAH